MRNSRLWRQPLAHLSLCRSCEWLQVAAIITLGAALRIWSPAMRADLWYDETYSLIVAQRPLGQMMHLLLVGGDTNPPLYTILLHFWLKLGDSDLCVKLLSLTFGVASLGATYVLGKRVGGKAIGLLCCLLLATSESAITYSVEARPYALFLFLSVLSTHCLLIALDRNDGGESRRNAHTGPWICYAASSCLLVYTHWFGLLVLVVQIVALLVHRPLAIRTVQDYVLALAAVMFLGAPLISFLRNQVRLQNEVGGFSWPGPPHWHSLVDVISFLAGGRNLLFIVAAVIGWNLLRHGGRFRPGGGALLRALRARPRLVFFAGYFVIPVVLVASISSLLPNYSFFVPRYFLPFTIGIHVLLAHLLTRLRRPLAYLLLLAFVFAPVFRAARHWRAPETPYSAIAAELPSHVPRDGLITHLSPMSYYPVLHYRGDQGTRNKVLCEQASDAGYVLGYNLKGEMLGSTSLVEIRNLLERYSELWVVVDSLDQDDRVKELWEQIRRAPQFSMVSERQLGGVRVEYYRRDPLQAVLVDPIDADE